MKAHEFHENHRGDRRLLKWTLTASIVFHLAALAGMAVYKVAEARRTVFLPFNMVELAPVQEGPRHKSRAAQKPPAPKPEAPKAAEAKPAPKPPPPQLKKVQAPPQPALPPRIAKKVEDTPALKPEKKAEPKPPPPEYTEADLKERLKRLKAQVPDKEASIARETRTEADVKASIDKIRARAGETSQAVDSVVSNLKIVAGGPTGAARAQTIAEMRFAAYRTALWAHVKKSWNLPPSLAGRGLTAVLVANVTRNGVISKCWVEAGSGFEAFDQTALRALIGSSPLPEIPPDIPDEAFAEGLGFRFSE